MLPPVCNRFFELPSPLPLRKYTVINAKGVRTERRTADTSSSLQRVTSPNIFWALKISKNEALHTLYLDLRVVNQAKNQFNKKNIFFFCQQAYYLDRTSEWPGRLWRTISTTVQPPPSPPPHRSPSRTCPGTLSSRLTLDHPLCQKMCTLVAQATCTHMDHEKKSMLVPEGSSGQLGGRGGLHDPWLFETE